MGKKQEEYFGQSTLHTYRQKSAQPYAAIVVCSSKYRIKFPILLAYACSRV